MLKLRIISSLILVPLVLWALFAWPLPWFAAFIGVMILAGAWEWGALAGLRSMPARLSFVGTVGVTGIVLFLYPSWIPSVLTAATIFWAWVLVEQIVMRRLDDGVLMSPVGKLASGLLVLVPTWVAVVALRQQPHGEWFSLFLYFLVWGADTCAYIAGHAYGKHKLSPKVSPGKSWEGVGGALVWAAVLSLATGWYVSWPMKTLVIWLGLSMLTVMVSVLGDLFESRIKRVAGVKDSGQLMPGHGGILDRIDAMTAAAPFFLTVWLIWRHLAGETWA